MKSPMGNCKKNNKLLEAALRYVEKGWRVLPLRPKGKEPLMKGWGEKASTDKETIREWWTRWPNANIGLACGKGSGFFVLDLDGQEGMQSHLKFEKEHGRLPETLEQVTGREKGGTHLFFKYPSEQEVRNKANILPGVDVRGEGGYAVVAPSIHPTGQRYIWAEEGEPIADAPPALMKLISEKPKDEPEQKPIIPKISDNDITDRARLYLAECDPSIDGHDGSSALLWAARALVVGFEMDDNTALSLLWSEFNPRCNPVYDRDNPKHAQIYEHKVAEVRRTPCQKPAGWLLDEYGLRSGNDEETLEYGRQLAEGLLAGGSEEDSEPDQPESMPECPEWLLKPPGLVGDICAWINRTAGSPQPLLTLGAALVACGAIFGRKVRDRSNGRTNLYAMGVAKSSAGKDHPADCIERLIHEAGGQEILGAKGVTSDSAIETALNDTSPVQLFTWDEIGHMMKNIKAASGSNPYLATIVPTLMILYSSAHKTYIGKQRAHVKPYVIEQPHVCLWGYTSPDVLYDGIKEGELRDGWLARIMTFISDKRPPPDMKNSEKPPAELVKQVQAWLQRQLPPPEGMGDIQATVSVNPILYQDTSEAKACFERFRYEAYERMLEAEKTDDSCQYLWGKALQNARRIALIIAAGDCFDGGKIEQSHAEYGCALARFCVEQFTVGIHNKACMTDYEKLCQRVLAKVKFAPKKQITRSKLLKQMQIDAKRFNDLINTLKERNDISEFHSPTGGRPVTIYTIPKGKKGKK